MKKNYRTIKDLVRLLNRNKEGKNFYIDDFANIGLCFINEIYNNESHQLVEFNKNSKNWHTMALFGLENNSVQKEIMDFIYTTDSNHWFDELEKKYYIAVGMYDRTSKIIYFKNDYEHDFKLRTMIDFNEGDLQECDIFTESEIKDLKSTLPENMAKIVDLGKVEVKNENN